MNNDNESIGLLFAGVMIGFVFGIFGSCAVVDKQATRTTLGKAIPCTTTNQGQVVCISGDESWIVVAPTGTDFRYV